MARVSVLKESILLCGRAGVTPFVWGHRGMGKSAIVRQVAATNGMGFVDMRASQMEASDLRGLPDRCDGRTVYLPPAEMPIGDLTQEQALEALLSPFLSGPWKDQLKGSPEKQHARLLELVDQDLHAKRVYNQTLKSLQPRFERGIIFLDELNRAQDDVQQAAFQFVLDREIGQYVLPPGWQVVVAGNYNEGYQVSGFTDPAFLDRFCHLTFWGGDATLEDWIYYMSNAHGQDASAVVEFASQNVKHLDGEVSGELGFSVQPSRRSWESVVRVERAAAQGGFSEDARIEVIAGLVGRDIAQTYTRYNCPVKPRDLLSKGVKHHQPVLEKLQRGQLTGLMWGLVAAVKGNEGQSRLDDDSVANVCLDFAYWLVKHHKDKDICVAFCRALVAVGVSPEQERARTAVISNPKLAAMIGKYNARTGGRQTFIERLNSRPELQAVLQQVAWGGRPEDD